MHDVGPSSDTFGYGGDVCGLLGEVLARGYPLQTLCPQLCPTATDRGIGTRDRASLRSGGRRVGDSGQYRPGQVHVPWPAPSRPGIDEEVLS
jgi:hypothetical protein